MKVLRNRKARAGLLLLGLFVVLATVGPAFVGDPTDFVARPLQAPDATHWFGTDGQGRDVLAQTVVGARITLGIGFAVGAMVVLLGCLVGGVAGYTRGWVDDALSLVTNVFLVLPGLPLMVVLAAFLPPGPATIAAVLTLTGWAWNARVLRAQVLAMRDRDFVSAAILAGESSLRVLFVELLPNLGSLLASAFLGATIYAIGAQVGLEFLGLGDLGTVTWGTNLYWAANDAALLTGAWWTFVPTGLCIALVGFALTLINFGIDELANPRLAGHRAWRRTVGEADPGVTPVVHD
jgi:peptide/nickel transport system permease protein